MKLDDMILKISTNALPDGINRHDNNGVVSFRGANVCSKAEHDELERVGRCVNVCNIVERIGIS